MRTTQNSTSTIEVTPGSDLAAALDEGKQVVLVKDGVRYRVHREDAAQPTEDVWADYGPEKVRQMLKRTAGSWTGVDIDAFKAEIREQRGQDSHGRPA